MGLLWGQFRINLGSLWLPSKNRGPRSTHTKVCAVRGPRYPAESAVRGTRNKRGPRSAQLQICAVRGPRSPAPQAGNLDKCFGKHWEMLRCVSYRFLEGSFAQKMPTKYSLEAAIVPNTILGRVLEKSFAQKVATKY